MEIVAFVHDQKFNYYIDDRVFQLYHNCNLFPQSQYIPEILHETTQSKKNITENKELKKIYEETNAKAREELKRTLPYEPVSISFMTLAIILCCVSLIITSIYWKTRTAKLLVLMVCFPFFYLTL